jgi:hypothetical protein
MLLSGGDRPWRLAHTPRPSVGQIESPSGAEEVLSGQAGLAQPLCSTHSQREATVAPPGCLRRARRCRARRGWRRQPIWIGNIERGSAPRERRRPSPNCPLARRCPSCSGRPRFDDVRFRGGHHRNRPQEDVFRDSGLPHGGHQMAGDGGEVIMANSEAGVGLVKRASVVVCRAAEHLRYQQHLVALESRKIDPFEVPGGWASRRTRS